VAFDERKAQPMLSQQRQDQIYSLIKQRKSALVTELSEALGISMSTVRRDLTELEERGLVQRVHGGAILIQAEGEPPVMLRADQNAEAKTRIAAAAAALVHDGDTIILTSGSTVMAMLPFLVARQNLTIITNVINVAYRLASYPHISVVVLGGWLRHSEFSLLGHLTQESLKDLYASRIFHGTFGLDPGYGLTGTYVQEVETDRYLINAAAQLIVLADASKFEHIGPIRLVPIDRIHTLITEPGAPGAILAQLESRGVRVVLA
jgi:DeoR/GlpR family transcriptional regulator of sugar metabolism